MRKLVECLGCFILGLLFCFLILSPTPKPYELPQEIERKEAKIMGVLTYLIEVQTEDGEIVNASVTLTQSKNLKKQDLILVERKGDTYSFLRKLNQPEE